MPLYMDIHELHGATPEDIAKAHEADLVPAADILGRLLRFKVEIDDAFWVRAGH